MSLSVMALSLCVSGDERGRPTSPAPGDVASTSVWEARGVVLTGVIQVAVRVPVGVLERALDRALAGPLTDAIGRSMADHRVIERVVSAANLDRLVDALLEDPRTELMLERALASPGLERLVMRVLDSRFVDNLTERLLDSPEMQRVIEHIASSPEVLAAVTAHTETLAEEMVSDVRRRSRAVDDVAERTVRTWLRRPPRPQAT